MKKLLILALSALMSLNGDSLKNNLSGGQSLKQRGSG